MQIHGPSETVDEIRVHLNPGNKRPFAVVGFGSAELYLQSPADADELIRAGIRAKSMLLGETSEPAGDAE